MQQGNRTLVQILKMMTAEEVLQKIRFKFPELDTLGSFEIDACTEVAQEMGFDGLQLVYATAHLCTTTYLGEVMERNVADVSAKFKLMSESGRTSFWTRTKYGQLLVNLIRSRPGLAAQAL